MKPNTLPKRTDAHNNPANLQARRADKEQTSPTARQYAQLLLIEAQSRQRDIPELLRQAQLPANFGRSTSIEDISIGIDNYCKLYRAISHLWQIEADYQEGYTPADQLTFRNLCYVLISANTLAEALQRTVDFCCMFNQQRQSVMLDINSGHITFILRRSGPVPKSRVLATEINGLTILHRLFSWLIGEYISLEELGLCGQPDSLFRQVDLYQLFHCPVKNGLSENYFRFSADYLLRSIVQTERSLAEFLPQAPYHLVVLSDPKPSLTERIRCLIGDELSRELPAFEELTDIFHTSATSLRRHLRKENTSYQQIKDDCRREAAMKLLNQAQHTVDQIAIKVGFSDANTFRRAFKKWTGMAPSDYRESCIVQMLPAKQCHQLDGGVYQIGELQARS